MSKEMHESHVGKVKDLQTPGLKKNPYQNSDPIRAMEPHVEDGRFGNHNTAARISPTGHQFGRAGNAPDKSNHFERGIGTKTRFE